jgi:hypothetical protein
MDKNLKSKHQESKNNLIAIKKVIIKVLTSNCKGAYI